MEIGENNFHKSEGQIRFEIGKLSEFARAPAGTQRLSTVVFVRGLPWRFLTTSRESAKQIKEFNYFLLCCANNPDPGWSCAVKAKLKILSQKEGKKDHVGSFSHVYSVKECTMGFFISFKNLMAPEYGFYNAQSDDIILEAQFTADAPQGIKNNMGRIFPFTNAKPNARITVNKQCVEVNSHAVSLYSTYFERYFFDNRHEKAENIELNPPTTIEDFKRMIATLPPEQRQLDDDCIEAVLILADRFFVDCVLELCRDFLLRASRKPKLFKFRMAHRYGWSEMKEKVLESISLDEFSMHFFENAAELALLDEDAKAALAAHHAKLLSGMKK